MLMTLGIRTVGFSLRILANSGEIRSQLLRSTDSTFGLSPSKESVKRRRIGTGTIGLEFLMEKSVFVQARDLPPEKRHAAEVLLGGALGEDELVLIRSSKGRILKPGLTGDALTEAYRQFFDWSAEMAKRVEHVPECEIDAAIDEAVDFVRHHRG